MDAPTREHGPQPLDELMTRWKLTNHELVTAASDQLNHKQVQKARKGRQLTLHLMQKVMRAFNTAAAARLGPDDRPAFVEYPHRQLFDYAKGHDPGWLDPNEPIIPNPPK
jgi:hypothetical protein